MYQWFELSGHLEGEVGIRGRLGLELSGICGGVSGITDRAKDILGSCESRCLGHHRQEVSWICPMDQGFCHARSDSWFSLSTFLQNLCVGQKRMSFLLRIQLINGIFV